MPKNIFFEKKGPFKPGDLFRNNVKSKDLITDIQPLVRAKKNDITFYDSLKYKDAAKLTKASYCITTSKLKDHLPLNCEKIIVPNVLYALADIAKKLYPFADIDYPDLACKKKILSKYKGVKFGNNVLVGKNVKIGKNSYIGNNTIIESNVSLGNNCVIGSQVVIKNSLIGDNVVIQDGCKIGLKGFGFIPLNGKNIKFPHIGKVIIGNNIEIAASCTIDRGSIDDTEIGDNTYLDNQVHVAHNVKIGKNCMIAGQVGFAGSSTIGDNVSIGGQAGISGHLKIGNNVKIAGGSGVIKDIDDNTVVMGYPAIPLKDFIKRWKNDD
jgi:UDP-3-O-[3-hydroxymyristoyl] glucosamine N-acyltransferase